MISAIQLFLLSGTLPRDQDAMEADLAMYAEEALRRKAIEDRVPSDRPDENDDDSDDDASQQLRNSFLEEGISSTWDGQAARETLTYVRKGVEEINNVLPFHCGPNELSGSSSSSDEEDAVNDNVSPSHMERWRKHRNAKSPLYPNEATSLMS